MNIIDALNEVLIHEASSIPRCKAPRMSAGPTLINRPVHVVTIAPKQHAGNSEQWMCCQSRANLRRLEVGTCHWSPSERVSAFFV